MKNNFKTTIKYICLILCLSVSFCATACNGTSVQTGDKDKISVVTAIFPSYDFAKQVFGDRADVTLLLPPGTEAHNFEPSPRDIIKIQNCDLFIYNGGVSDAWVDKILSSMGQKPETLKMMDASTLLNYEHEEHTHEHSHDEHVWMNVENAALITKAICDTACSIDEKNGEYYTSNANDYIQKLSELNEKFKRLSESVTNKTLVFADRFPARYFTESYGFDYLSAFDGCADKAEPGSAKIAELIDNVKSNNIPVAFYIEFSNQKVADAVCEATGAAKRLFHSCHNVTAEEFEYGITYLELMELNYTTVSEALG